MTRREAIAVSLGAMLGTFVRPTPRRTINLLDYCGGEGFKYDCRLPYVYEDWTYATDSFICLRVRPVGSDKAEHKGKIPPFEQLTFNHEKLRGWKTLPKLDPIVAKDSYCPACNGFGRIGHQINWKDCKDCDGYGHQMTYSYWNDHGIESKCKTCFGRGFPISEECQFCKGVSIATIPGIVSLNGHYFDYGIYEKVRKLNVEYVQDYWSGRESMPFMKFKFAEGDGMVMGLDKVSSERRIADAKS